MNRVFVAPGAGQLLYLLCALEESQSNPSETNTSDESHFLLYEKSNGSLGVMTSMAEAVGKCSSILKFDRSNHIDNKKSLSEYCDSLGNIDEVWSCMPANKVDRFVLRRFPKSDFVFYEDGLRTYGELEGFLDLAKHPRRLLKFLLRKFYSALGMKVNYFPFTDWPFRKIKRAHLILSRFFPLPKYMRGVDVIQTSENAVREFTSILSTIALTMQQYPSSIKDIVPPVRWKSNRPGSWIGANAILLPGVTIGENAVVGAGSVVTKSVPPRTVFAGNPASKIKDLV